MAASGAQAQQQLSPDEFLDRAEGRTFTFEQFPRGGLAGVEQFLSRTRTVWAAAGGTCTYGKIELRGPQICFIYEAHPNPENCWTPFNSDDGLVVVATSGSIQRVTRVTREPVICEDDLLS